MSSEPGIDVQGASTINGGAQLNGGVVTIEGSQTLTFGNATITGTTFNDPGTIQIGSNKTLTLAGTDTITGGIFNVGGGRAQAGSGGSVQLTALSIGDMNGGNPNPLTLTVQVSTGSFTLNSVTGLTVGTPGTDSTGGEIVTLTGSLSNINAALNSGIVYTPGAGTSNTLTVSVSDGSGDSAFKTGPSIRLWPDRRPSRPPLRTGRSRTRSLLEITGVTTLIADTVFNKSATVQIDAPDI